MILINKRIFVFGGFQEGGVLNDLFSIDLLAFTWTKVDTQGPAPNPRQGMSSARVGKKIYISSGCDFRENKCYTDTYILDADSLWWTKVNNTYGYILILVWITLTILSEEMTSL
jgi:N-acetylneuraminic acid mutarotase